MAGTGRSTLLCIVCRKEHADFSMPVRCDCGRALEAEHDFHGWDAEFSENVVRQAIGQ
jgi:hypothetical protein